MSFPLYSTSSGNTPENLGVIIYAGMTVIQIQPGLFINYTAANALIYVGSYVGIALNTCTPGNSLSAQLDGLVPQDLFTCGPGSESTVVVTGTGGVARGTAGLVLGECDPAGVICVRPTRIGSQYSKLHCQAAFGQPTLGQSPVLDSTGKFIFSTVLQSNSVSGSGLWHSTAGTLDPAAYIGAADTILVTNHAATATAWIVPGGDVTYASNNFTVVGLQTHPVSSTAPTEGQFLIEGAASWAPTTLTQDVTASVTVPGQMSVVGILTHALPGLSAGYLQWTGAAWAFGSGGSVVTWANDLAGSTNSGQFVAAISGNAGGGGIISVNATALQFGSSQTNPFINQAALVSDVATSSMLIKGQNAALGSTVNKTGGSVTISGGNGPTANATGGSVFLNGIGGGGSGANGATVMQVGGNTVMSIGSTAQTGSAGDPSFSFGANPPYSSTLYAVKSDGSSYLTVNAPSNAGTMNLNVNNVNIISMTQGLISFGTGLQGTAGFPFNWSATTYTLGHSGTTSQTSTAYTLHIPTDSGLTGGATITLPTVAGKIYFFDVTGVTFGGQTLTIQCGGAAATVVCNASTGKFFCVYTYNSGNSCRVLVF